MSRSCSVSSENGTSVRTPIARHTSVIRDHISEFQGATAPSSMERDSSGTKTASFTVLTTPVPPQFLQAPLLLKEKLSALGPSNEAPHSGQTSGFPAATWIDGGSRCPLGQRWLPRRENISRSGFKSSVDVPNVLRIPGTVGRWWRARAAGTYSMLSILASAACVMRRRV